MNVLHLHLLLVASVKSKYVLPPLYKTKATCVHMCPERAAWKLTVGKSCSFFSFFQNHDYVILEGARRKEQRWDPRENEQIVPEGKWCRYYLNRCCTVQVYYKHLPLDIQQLAFLWRSERRRMGTCVRVYFWWATDTETVSAKSHIV